MENILAKKSEEEVKSVLDLSPGTRFRVVRTHPVTGDVTKGIILKRGSQRIATYRRPADGVETSVPLMGDEKYVLVNDEEQNIPAQLPLQLKFA